MNCTYIVSHLLLTGLRKKLNKLASRRVSYKPISRWVPALVAHMWHVIENSTAGLLRLDWWKSCSNHVANIHVHDSEEFPKCLHGEPTAMYNDDGEELIVDYLEPG